MVDPVFLNKPPLFFLQTVNGVSGSHISTPKSNKSSTPSPTSPRTPEIDELESVMRHHVQSD
uniref:Uncharacterized protein n=1 Tax=Sphaeramia orbicularis TaxID=375764 RepID=A0A672Z2D2_9TELE